MSTEGIDESLHGLGGIEEIPSKIGGFSRTQKRRFEETRDSGGFSTRLDGLESPQRVTQSSRNTSSSRGQESTKENRNSTKTRYENKRNSKAPRAQGGKGLLSHTISVQSLNNPWLKSLVLERRGREPRERGVAPGRGWWRVFCLWLAQRNRGEG